MLQRRAILWGRGFDAEFRSGEYIYDKYNSDERMELYLNAYRDGQGKVRRALANAISPPSGKPGIEAPKLAELPSLHRGYAPGVLYRAGRYGGSMNPRGVQ